MVSHCGFKILFFYFKIYFTIYFWLLRLSLVAESKGSSLIAVHRLLICVTSVVAACGSVVAGPEL